MNNDINRMFNKSFNDMTFLQNELSSDFRNLFLYLILI